MNFRIQYTRKFEKHFIKLSNTEKAQVKKKIKLLASNPAHPSLRVKRIQGTKDFYECSVNMDIRVIWYYEGDTMIILVDVGHHNILRRY